MIYRSGNPGDFQHVETFVWQAIFPAFDHPDLNDAQRASNDAIIETARKDCYEAMGNPKKKIFVAWDERRKELAGFVIVDKSPYDFPELVSLIVSRRNWGKGVAPELMKLGLDWLGTEKAVKLGVIHYNERALAFFKRYGFEDTGETAGEHLIPRVLMLRDASAISIDDPFPELEPEQKQIWEPVELESPEKIDELFAEPGNEEPVTTEESELELLDINSHSVDDLTAPPEKKLLRKPQVNLIDFKKPLEEAYSDEVFEDNKEEVKETILQPSNEFDAKPSDNFVEPGTENDFVELTDLTVESEEIPSPVSQQETLFERQPAKAVQKQAIEFEVDHGEQSAKVEPIEEIVEEDSVDEDFTFEFAFSPPETPVTKKTSPGTEIDWELPHSVVPEYLAPDEPQLNSSMTLDELATAYANQEVEELRKAGENSPSDGVKEKQTTPLPKLCANCQESLPEQARFCLKCGAPQSPQTTRVKKVYLEEEEEVLDLPDLKSVPVIEDVVIEAPAVETLETEPGKESVLDSTESTGQKNADKAAPEKEPQPAATKEQEEEIADYDDFDLFDWELPLLRQFRERFREDFADFVKRFFGSKQVAEFVAELAQSEFQHVIDNALEGVNRWAEDRELDIAVNQVIATLKYQRVAGDLIEYFVVEEAKEIHKVAFPQRLLRYQSTEWAKTDLFRMTTDYLDFEHETETVYTDFITLPAKKLKNATQNFLFANRDERIFFIADLSITGSLKSGFAFTDSGIYWKNVLQPNHAAYFNEIKTLEVKRDHLLINGHFFDAGKQLNFKVAMLLAKLSRLMP